MSVVINRFKETIYCELQDLKETQGDLKSLSKSDYKKFKSQLIHNGFTAPFIIWITPKGIKQILDGHTRKYCLLKMQDEGVVIPKSYPCNVIEAKTRKEAVQILMSLVSQYGKTDMESLSDFVIKEELDFEWLKLNTDIPGIDLNFEEPEESISVPSENKETECPECGHKWSN